VGVLAALTWLSVAALFRISSLAGLAAAALSPLFAFATDQPRPILYLTLVMAVLIFIRHRANIGRLLKGRSPHLAPARPSPRPPGRPLEPVRRRAARPAPPRPHRRRRPGSPSPS
jgi:glycerol-3-phosphate acyltransferase PlsY